MDAIREGKKVRVRIELKFELDGTRPIGVTYNDWINGKKKSRWFDNV